MVYGRRMYGSVPCLHTVHVDYVQNETKHEHADYLNPRMVKMAFFEDWLVACSTRTY